MKMTFEHPLAYFTISTHHGKTVFAYDSATDKTMEIESDLFDFDKSITVQVGCSIFAYKQASDL